MRPRVHIRFLRHRTSINREPWSISATMAGNSGVNHARKARLEQLPIRNQTMSGACRLCFARAAKFFIFGQQDRPMIQGVTPYWRIFRVAQPDFFNVFCLVPGFRHPAGQIGWKLSVNDELQSNLTFPQPAPDDPPRWRRIPNKRICLPLRDRENLQASPFRKRPRPAFQEHL